MKKIFTSAFVLLLTIGAVNAQVISNPKDGRKADKQEMKGHKGHDGQEFKKLNLTAEQKAQLKTIHQDFKTQSDALKNQKLTQDEFQAKRKELHEQFRTKSEAILTADQKAQLAQMKTNFKEKHKEGKDKVKGQFDGDHADRGGRPGMDRGQLQKELNLTAEQQQKMQQLRSEFRPKMQALRNDQSLTQDQKRAKMQELMKQQQEQMKSILTPEQIQKMQSLRKDRFNKDSK